MRQTRAPGTFALSLQAIQALGGLDVALVLAASAPVFAQGVRLAPAWGRLVCVAMPADDATMDVPIFELVIKGIFVINSIVETRQDLVEVFALHAAGRTRVIAETRRIEDVDDAIADVLTGQVPALIVFDFAPVPAVPP